MRSRTIGPSRSTEVEATVTSSPSDGATGEKPKWATGGRFRTSIVCF